MGKNYEVRDPESLKEAGKAKTVKNKLGENQTGKSEDSLTKSNNDITYPVPDLRGNGQLNINSRRENEQMDPKNVDPEQLKRERRESPETKKEAFDTDEPAGESEDPVGIKNPRYSDRTPVALGVTEKEVVEKIAEEGVKNLGKSYQPRFGIVPSADHKENFYEQVWTRDFAQATLNYFAVQNHDAVMDSLETVFRHQREDGAIPYKTERRYALVQLVSPYLAKRLFKLVRGEKERPLYEGEDFSSAEDTIPMAIMAAGEFVLASPGGKRFAREDFAKFEKAIEFFGKKVDPRDGLAVMRNTNADWCDSLDRGGKLGGINVLWVRALRLMGSVAQLLGETDKAAVYREEASRVKKGVMEKFYDREGAYFREEEGVDRLYTTACVTGSLYLLDPEECVRVQETLKRRVKVPSGLKNFDPPFPENRQVKVFGIPVIRWFNNGYHNESVWPWLNCQNIQVKIKIALNHSDEAVRKQYKKEAVEDLADMAEMFQEAGGAYEIFHPETRKPRNRIFYKPPRNLMGGLAAYQSAYNKMKKLGWI